MNVRYRYITCGIAKISDRICDFRLITRQVFNTLSVYPMRTYYRVKIPADMNLNKDGCDDYYTTDDTRTLKELGCELFLIDGNLKHVKLDINISDADLKRLEREVMRDYMKSIEVKEKSNESKN